MKQNGHFELKFNLALNLACGPMICRLPSIVLHINSIDNIFCIKFCEIIKH